MSCTSRTPMPMRSSVCWPNPNDRRMLATFRLLAHDRDSLAWASLLLLTPGIGQTFCDYIYERARIARVQFGESASLTEPISPKRRAPLAGSAR